MTTQLFTLLIPFLFAWGETKESVQFKAEDGLEINADLYMVHDKDAPFIILFHQAGWSRGEYLEIAPKLNDMGYNCMAVDQRSGSAVNGIENETSKRALSKGLPTDYPDALPDLYAAINFVKTTYKPSKLIIWGSSYSSALVLKITGDNPDLVNAAMAFAPGEYFSRFGKSEDWISQSAKNINVPIFITSAKKEHANWKGIYDVIPSEQKQSFLPSTEGKHGSRALWEKFDDNEAYWKAVIRFLNSLN